MLLIPTLIAFAIGFFVILLRRIILVACVIAAPLALIAYILPGTESLWKFWKKTFSGAILMFPFITGIIALGGVMAYVTDNGTSGDAMFAPLLALIFLIAPFFMLPKMVTNSGGMMGTIGGAASNLNRNLGGRAKKSRQKGPAKKKSPRPAAFGATAIP